MEDQGCNTMIPWSTTCDNRSRMYGPPRKSWTTSFWHSTGLAGSNCFLCGHGKGKDSFDENYMVAMHSWGRRLGFVRDPRAHAKNTGAKPRACHVDRTTVCFLVASGSGGQHPGDHASAFRAGDQDKSWDNGDIQNIAEWQVLGLLALSLCSPQGVHDIFWDSDELWLQTSESLLQQIAGFEAWERHGGLWWWLEWEVQINAMTLAN